MSTPTIDDLPDAVIVIDAAGVIESSNRAASKLLGVRAGLHLGDALGTLDARRVLDSAERLKAGTELRMDVWAESISTPLDLHLTNLDGRYVASLRTRTTIGRSSPLRHNFVSVVSHELRTPLTALSGSLSLLAGGVGGELPASARTLVDMATRNSVRLAQLIDDILDIESLQSGKMRFRWVDVDVVALVEQALATNQGYADAFGVTWKAELPPRSLHVVGDPDRLTQVLANLLSNAAKYSPKGGSVRVRAFSDGITVTIEIEDTGPGIPEEFRPYVFDQFAQADSSTTRRKGGTGLGLSIARSIVDQHRGQIGFKTKTGAGTVFYVRLPVRTEDGPPKELFVEEPSGIRRRIRKERSMVQPSLARLGFVARELEGVLEDVTVLENEQSRYVAVDPRDLGPRPWRVLAELRARLPDLEFLLYSRDGRREDSESPSASIHLLDWLPSPLGPNDLSGALSRSRKQLGQQRPRVLGVEPNANVRTVLAAMLGRVVDLRLEASEEEAMGAMARQGFDVFVVDLATSHRLLEQVAGLRGAAVILVSAPDVATSPSTVAGALAECERCGEHWGHWVAP